MINTNKFLRIAQWNSNGLQNHKEELTIFLKQNYIDILLITETHLTYKNYFRIPSYKLCHTTHQDGTAHGGTAILIKESIQHYELLKYQEESIQATSIKVKGFPYEITVAAVYCPPKYKLKKEQFQTFFQTLGPRFIAGATTTARTLYGAPD
jgi:exonuclease III